MPSRVEFNVTKEVLYAFENENPKYEPLLKALLRSYAGIFDSAVTISEKQMAFLLRSDEDAIKQHLRELHQRNIIIYEPQKDNPQLLLLRSRVKVEELSINIVNYNQRKERFIARVKQMLRFVTEESACRSRIIGNYFGDSEVRACGICDNCLRLKNIDLSKEEFESLHHRIINMVKYESMSSRDLLLKLNDTKKEKAWKVLEFLQAEEKIKVDENGRIFLR